MSAVLTTSSRTGAWRQALVALALVWLLVGVLYADTFEAIVSTWSHSNAFAHGFLVPPIAIWLAWRRRDELARLVPRPQPWFLVAIVPIALLWLVSDIAVTNAGAQFAGVAMLVLSVPAVLGGQVARLLLFPLLFVFFGVPIGEFLLEPMMDWTAAFTVGALQLTGIPVYQQGRTFVIPSGEWSVVEACSGVRYLIASFMVGTLFAYLNYRSTRRRLAFVAVSLVVPVVANWLRAYLIVLLGHLSGNKLAVGADHLIYGWVFFGIVVTGMFFVGSKWAEPDAIRVPAEHARPMGPGPAAVDRSAWRGVGIVVVLMGLLAVPRVAVTVLSHQDADLAPPALRLPALHAGWTSAGGDVDFRPHFESPAAEATRHYAGANGIVGVHVAYYRRQSASSKLVSSVNTVLRNDDRKWTRLRTGRTEWPSGPVPVDWREVDVASAPSVYPAQHLLVWRCYWIDGRWTSSDVAAKFWGIASRLTGRGDDGAVLVLWTLGEQRDASQHRLRAFVDDNLPMLQQSLAAVRASR